MCDRLLGVVVVVVVGSVIQHVTRSVNFHYILFFALCCVDL